MANNILKSTGKTAARIGQGILTAVAEEHPVGRALLEPLDFITTDRERARDQRAIDERRQGVLFGQRERLNEQAIARGDQAVLDDQNARSLDKISSARSHIDGLHKVQLTDMLTQADPDAPIKPELMTSLMAARQDTRDAETAALMWIRGDRDAAKELMNQYGLKMTIGPDDTPHIEGRDGMSHIATWETFDFVRDHYAKADAAEVRDLITANKWLDNQTTKALGITADSLIKQGLKATVAVPALQDSIKGFTKEEQSINIAITSLQQALDAPNQEAAKPLFAAAASMLQRASLIPLGPTLPIVNLAEAEANPRDAIIEIKGVRRNVPELLEWLKSIDGVGAALQGRHDALLAAQSQGDQSLTPTEIVDGLSMEERKAARRLARDQTGNLDGRLDDKDIARAHRDIQEAGGEIIVPLTDIEAQEKIDQGIRLKRQADNFVREWNRRLAIIAQGKSTTGLAAKAAKAVVKLPKVTGDVGAVIVNTVEGMAEKTAMAAVWQIVSNQPDNAVTLNEFKTLWPTIKKSIKKGRSERRPAPLPGTVPSQIRLEPVVR